MDGLRWLMRAQKAMQPLSPCWRRHSERCASAALSTLIGSSPRPPKHCLRSVCGIQGFEAPIHIGYFESARHILCFAQTHSAPPPSHRLRRLSIPHSHFGGLCECIAAENARMRVGAFMCAVCDVLTKYIRCLPYQRASTLLVITLYNVVLSSMPFTRSPRQSPTQQSARSIFWISVEK